MCSFILEDTPFLVYLYLTVCNKQSLLLTSYWSLSMPLASLCLKNLTQMILMYILTQVKTHVEMHAYDRHIHTKILTEASSLLCQRTHGQLWANALRRYKEIDVLIYVSESSAMLPLLYPAMMTVSTKQSSGYFSQNKNKSNWVSLADGLTPGVSKHFLQRTKVNILSCRDHIQSVIYS